jgi:hypothetical protein
MRNTRRWGAVGAATAAGMVLVTAAAWACIAGPTLNLNPATVKAGQEVALSGFSYKGDLPIVVRFNGLNGPVLGTFEAAEGRFGDNEILAGKVTIPPDTKPGNYVLIATQSTPDGNLAQVPVRALVTVTADGGAPVVGAPVIQAETGRPVGPAVAERSASVWTLVLLGLGAAGVATLLVGAGAVLAGRRRARPEMARVARG